MANVFDKLPKKVALAILLIKALDLKEAIKLTQQIMYLWREFSIKTNISPIIETFRVSFYYKDDFISKVKVRDLKEILPIITEIEQIQVNKERKKEGR
ncbi:MAG: hypothetical protein NC218_08465 [Acetobacter sp.]|nr:hypothetical protein [Acetobacter sp.]